MSTNEPYGITPSPELVALQNDPQALVHDLSNATVRCILNEIGWQPLLAILCAEETQHSSLGFLVLLSNLVPKMPGRLLSTAMLVLTSSDLNSTDEERISQVIPLPPLQETRDEYRRNLTRAKLWLPDGTTAFPWDTYRGEHTLVGLSATEHAERYADDVHIAIGQALGAVTAHRFDTNEAHQTNQHIPWLS